jgi:hypothetical protein
MKNPPMSMTEPLFDSKTLDLHVDNAIGMGNRRWVFQHPDNPKLCIKVARQAHIREQLNAKGGLYRHMPTTWRDDNVLEARAYRQKALTTTHPYVWQHLPHMHGWQATNLGPGLVFDYYTDAQGQPAANLETVLQTQGATPALEVAVENLHAYILKTEIWMRHPGPPNIVWAADGHLKLIDCLGTYTMGWQHRFAGLRQKRLKRHCAYLDTAIARALT